MQNSVEIRTAASNINQPVRLQWILKYNPLSLPSFILLLVVPTHLSSTSRINRANVTASRDLSSLRFFRDIPERREGREGGGREGKGIKIHALNES